MACGIKEACWWCSSLMPCKVCLFSSRAILKKIGLTEEVHRLTTDCTVYCRYLNVYWCPPSKHASTATFYQHWPCCVRSLAGFVFMKVEESTGKYTMMIIWEVRIFWYGINAINSGSLTMSPGWSKRKHPTLARKKVIYCALVQAILRLLL